MIANFVGVYVYDYFKEDVLFIQLGKNWLNGESSKFSALRNFVAKKRIFIFIVISIWPSPIASYLLLRDNNKESPWKILLVIAVGSVFCTAFWWGGISMILYSICYFVSILKIW